MDTISLLLGFILGAVTIILIASHNSAKRPTEKEKYSLGDELMKNLESSQKRLEFDSLKTRMKNYESKANIRFEKLLDILGYEEKSEKVGSCNYCDANIIKLVIKKKEKVK